MGASALSLRARALVRLLAGVCLVGALASCGGDDDAGNGDSDGGSKDSDRVTDVIRTAATTTDPGHCTKLLTPRFLEQSEQTKGRAAIESCREDAGDTAGNARSVTVSKVEVGGDTATATAAFEGGNSDGQAVNLSLVKQGDQWKLDHIDSYARFDRRRFLTAIRASLIRPPDALPEAVAICITRRLDRLSDREIQDFAIKADPAAGQALVTPCIQDLQREQGAGAEAPAARRPKFRSPDRTVA